MSVEMTAKVARLAVVCLLLATATASGQEFKTIIGPPNVDLHEGAQLLMAERTLRGLEHAATPRERVAGLSNACAGYVMLDQPEEALNWCNRALELQDRHWRARTNRALAYLKLGRFEECDADISLAEELAPGARTVKRVRAMLLDATDPVTPQIVVDDRRQPADDDPQ